MNPSAPSPPARRKLSQRGLEEPFVRGFKALSAVVAKRFPRLYSRLQQGRFAIELLLQRRLWLYLLADGMLLLMCLFTIMGEGATDSDYYSMVVIVPFLLIGVPALSGALALERRAGSLDLALAVPSTERYFVRRVLPICLALVIQGWCILALVIEGWGNLFRSMAQSLLVAMILGALSLFWAVRLKTAGAVLMASLATVFALSQWILYDPMIVTSGGAPERILGIAVPVLDWVWNALVLFFAAVIFFQYARERLRRPERLIA